MKRLRDRWRSLLLLAMCLGGPAAQADSEVGPTGPIPSGAVVVSRFAGIGGPDTTHAPTATQATSYRSLQSQYLLSGLTQPFQITADGDTLYVSDVGANLIRVYQVSGGGLLFLRNIGAPGSGDGQFNGPEQVAIVGTDLFVTDFGNNRVQRFNKTTGAFVSKFGIAGSSPGQLSQPTGLVYSSATGLLYVSDVGNDRISSFTVGGLFVAQFGSLGTGDGQINNPFVLAIDRRGNIYAADSGNNRVVKFNSRGSYVRNIASGYLQPLGLTIDPADHLWLTVGGSNDIYCYDSSGSYLAYYYGQTPVSIDTAGYFASVRGIAVTSTVSTALFNGQPAVAVVDLGGAGVTGGVHLMSIVNQPVAHPPNGTVPGLGGFQGSIAFDSADNVYITSLSSNTVSKFDKFGSLITSWGSTGTGNGQFNGPYGITIDDNGFVYVADFNNQRIQKFSSSGAYQLQWGTMGSGSGQLNHPSFLANDGAFIYVTDENNNRIQKFTDTGSYVRQWGTAGAANGQFTTPAGLAVDRRRGLVYVAEFGGNRIQQFSVYGDFIKVFVDSTSGSGQLSSPRGLAFDGAGNLYAADSGNARVVQFNGNGTYLASFNATLPNGLGVSPHNQQLYVGTTAGSVVARFGAVSGRNDTIGVYRPSEQSFLLRNSNSIGAATIGVQVQGADAADLPVTGDWNGDGVDTPGLYRPSTTTFYLWDRWYDLALANADYSFAFGTAGDLPIAADWNADGTDGIGVFRPSTGQYLLRSALNTGGADFTFLYGLGGDQPLGGDWNTDGVCSAGGWRSSDGRFHVTNANVNGAVGDNGNYPLGQAGDRALVGDWSHAGYSGLGVFRPANATFYLKYNLDGTAFDSSVVFQPLGVGMLFKDSFEDVVVSASADLPLAGTWGSTPE